VKKNGQSKIVTTVGMTIGNLENLGESLIKYTINKPNRNKTRDKVSVGFWCWGCDQFYVRDGQRCRVCGQVANGKTRNKKSGPKE
jgi:rRNA maturation endonuclease Nob1